MFDLTSDSSVLTQFRRSYPMGSLISELLYIHENQYIVRVQVQMGGVILGTGLSADPILERAEDQARERAIAVLDGLPPMVNSAQKSDFVKPQPPKPVVSELTKNPSPQLIASAPEIPKPPQEQRVGEIEALAPLPSEPEEEFDFSDVSLKIEMELERIQWNAKNETDYLKRVYGKNKRLVLNDEEMKEFLEYLQTYAKTSVELKRLGWSEQQGKEYLKEKYPDSKGSRAFLTCSEMKEFLAYLQQPLPTTEEFF